jgi:short-subunit dehydrogenase
VEFGRQLAQRGLNVVLAARRRERLEALARELTEQFEVEARPLAVDLSGPAGRAALYEATAELDIGLLVPNAAVGSRGCFVEAEAAAAESLLQLNAASPMDMARHYGAAMCERGRGGIVFVASMLGYLPVPRHAHYAATKAYILSLGQALYCEMKPRGVDVVVLAPGLTRTEMTQNMRAATPTWLEAILYGEPAPVAAAGLRALGRSPSVVPGLLNRTVAFLGRRLSRRFRLRLVARLGGGPGQPLQER